MKIDDIKSYYNEVYYAKGSDHRSRNISDYKNYLGKLGVTKGRMLLDISCGRGELLQAAECEGLITYGIDISEKAIEIARGCLRKTKLYIGNAEELPFENNYFDYITNLGSLEHYLDTNVALREMWRVLKNDGSACIIVPNSYYLFNIIRVFKNGGGIGTGQIIEKTATKKEWIRCIEKSGLRVVMEYQDKEPLDVSWRNVFSDVWPKHVINRMMEKILQRIMPINLGYQFVFICKKYG